MRKNQIIIIAVAVVVILAIFGLFFTLRDSAEADPNANPSQSEQNFDFVKDDQASDPATYFESFGLNKFTINTYGGSADIKVVMQGSNKYALIRNPQNIGGLEFAASNSFGDYYFLTDIDGRKVSYDQGTLQGRFGYADTGEVSGKLIRERLPGAEYYAAYPSKDIAIKAGFPAIDDTGIANRFLSQTYLKIKNLNSNVEVIVEIDSRSFVEDNLLVSEATRKALGLNNGTLGSFSLELIPRENNTLGVVRR